MSLRDQLLQKGLASKKDARRVDQERLAERRREEGNAKRKRSLEIEKLALAEAARVAELEEKRQARAVLDARREAAERELRLRQLVDAHRVKARGPVPYFVVRPSGRLVRLDVPELIAKGLRCGEFAVVADPHVDDGVAVVARKGALRIAEVETQAVLRWVQDTVGISAAEEQFSQREWAPDLRARRVY